MGCDLTKPACAKTLPLYLNPELLAMSQDALGAPVRRVASAGDAGVPYGKSGTCGKEELPQNTVIAPCDAADPLQAWELLANGTLLLTATGECLQLDSGQGGCCSQAWPIWHNNVASALCNDPASCCASKQQLWALAGTSGAVVNAASGQCLTVHAAGMRNVGALPCAPTGVEGPFQGWRWEAPHLVSAVAPPGATARFCLARTPDVRGGATEVFAGPLANGDVAVLLWNRNLPAGANITAGFKTLGLPAGGSARVRDALARADRGVATGSVTAFADVHGVAVLRLTPL